MRNRELMLKRDRAMAEKFYELYEVKRMRMDDALKYLSEEVFYLDPKSIYNHIFYNKANSAYYDELVHSKGKAKAETDHPKLF